jgi:hypothetical protein
LCLRWAQRVVERLGPAVADCAGHALNGLELPGRRLLPADCAADSDYARSGAKSRALCGLESSCLPPCGLGSGPSPDGLSGLGLCVSGREAWVQLRVVRHRTQRSRVLRSPVARSAGVSPEGSRCRVVRCEQAPGLCSVGSSGFGLRGPGLGRVEQGLGALRLRVAGSRVGPRRANSRGSAASGCRMRRTAAAASTGVARGSASDELSGLGLRGLGLCGPDGWAGRGCAVSRCVDPTAVRAPTAVRFGPGLRPGMCGLGGCGRSWSVRSPCADRPAYPLHRV